MLGMPMKGGEEEAEGGELEDAMSDLGEALEGKDWSAAASAFRRATLCCDEGDIEE
jgi:hypothetical protein